MKPANEERNGYANWFWIPLILAGTGLLIFIGYYGILIFSFRDFGLKPWPPPLLRWQVYGRVEKVEIALARIYQQENMSIKYDNGNYFDLNILELPYETDRLRFEYAVYDCKEPCYWVNNGISEFCDSSILSLYRIYSNDSLIFDFESDERPSKTISPFLNLFKDVLISKLEGEVMKIPEIEWVKIDSTDSAHFKVLAVFKNEPKDTIATYRLYKSPSESCRTLSTVKHILDQKIILTYDDIGMYIAHKAVIHQTDTTQEY